MAGAVLVLIVLGGFTQASTAWAHVSLVSSAPGAGEQLDSVPAGVTLQFSDQLERDGAEIAVTGPDGTALESGAPIVSGDTIIQRVSDQGGVGQYSVTYLAVSGDGHEMTGRIDFAVGVPVDPGDQPRVTSAPSAEGAEAAEEASDDEGGASLILPGAIIALVVAAVLAWLVTRRRPARK